MKLLNRATLILLMLLTLLLLGTVGFHFIEGWPWFQSLYGTLMTVTTIGGEPENQLSHNGRVFNVVLMFLGFGVVACIAGMITQVVVQTELGVVFGRRRMEKEIAHLKDHIIICGAGRVGRRIAAEVSARNIPVLIVDRDLERLKWAQQHNHTYIAGDASSEAVLRQARIDTAAGLASAVTSDAQNVYIVLTARGIAPKIPIIARASEEDAESKLLRAGATAVISPYHYAGSHIARLLTRPNVQNFIDLALSSLSKEGLHLQIEEIQVNARCALLGKSLAEADLRKQQGIIVLAIRRKDGPIEFNPGPDHVIAEGDFLIAMGDAQKLKDLETLTSARR